jgi:hypothetical protein
MIGSELVTDMSLVPTSGFDYSQLDDETLVKIQELERESDAYVGTVQGTIGNFLLRAKEILPHGMLIPWAYAKYGISRITMWRYMQVAQGANYQELRGPNVSPVKHLATDIVEVEADKYVSPGVERWESEKQVYMPPDATSQLLQAPPLEKPALVEHPILNTLTSKSNEWYTPLKYIVAAHELMGGIDLDPASNAIANETVKAANYYDITQNGLDKSWTGRVWLNPPYGRDEAGSNQDIWSRRLIEQYNAGITTEAVLLVNAAVDTKWFQNLFQYVEREPHFFPVCIPDHRINFYSPDSTASGPTHGSALVYLGNQVKEFFIIFSEFGLIFERMVYRW